MATFGRFGPAALEAIVTGVGAATLSLVVGTLARHVRGRLGASRLGAGPE